MTDEKKNQETNRIDSFVKSADSFGFARSVHMCKDISFNRQTACNCLVWWGEGRRCGRETTIMSKAYAHAQNDISCFM